MRCEYSETENFKRKRKKGRFYYNQKINCMRAEGFAEYGCFMFCGEGAQPVLNVKIH